GFLGQHMLARLEPTDGVLGMHPVGQNDIDDVNLGIVLDRIVALVVIDVFGVHGVAQGELVGFVAMTAYQSNYFAFLALGKSWQDLADCQASEADNGPS